ncbi:MAG: ribosomal protein S16 [uncultured bacterium]|uniref:Small ribosomal subunit protein bS16 n=1 Tax=Candidatus Gottesmanbacteria bacterium RIFCSPLOWO2_01_FULL_43_11b TaxID=1798392 RepID=A0A1F6AGY8_9BACT|nr:MAG: ribosomal protein S16 [uncultured bacterium]OGG23673.1 MAG: 30S ribosomal protein S16 [Candidatus Gottesmanbacteria bacterium RIFCSPLOWO2_01_FULL_43_11b]
MVKIRLAQTGAKNSRKYRIVAIEEGKRRDGRTIELLGFYDPQVNPPHLSIKRDRVSYWLSVGAQLTDGTKKLLSEKKIQ